MIKSTPGATEGSVFQNRDFLLLWIAQALSQTAQNAIWYGLMVVVEEQTHSTTQMSLAVLTSILPSILLGLLAGVFVDHINTKPVLIITNALRAVATLCYLFYGTALGWVFVANFISCTISQFFGPAEASTIPQVVSKRQLITANSLFNLTFTGSQLAGMVILGPFIIKLFGPHVLFIGVAVIYGVCAVLVSFLSRGQEPTKKLTTLQSETLLNQLWTEIKDGWSFIKIDHKTSQAMINLTSMSCLLLVMSTLAPRYVVAVLQIPADNAVFVLAPAGLGVILGTSFLGRVTKSIPKEALVNIAILIFGGGFIVMGLLDTLTQGLPGVIAGLLGVPNLPIAVGIAPALMVLTIILGLQYSFVTVPSQTILMERAPTESRGRIFAVQMMLGNLVSVIPLLFVGGLADLFGIRQTIAIVGIVTIMIGILGIRKTRAAERAAQTTHSS